MADTLNVIVGADTTGLQQGLSQAKRLLSNFASSIATAAVNVGEFALSLVGPQGVALGLTAIGTALVKGIVEYGSFSAAVRALTGDLTDQEKAQKILREEFEKGFPKYAQQSGQISLLTNLANDNTVGVKNQAAAQGLLRQEIDKVVKSQDLQKTGTEAASGEMVDYARKVLLARVTLQGFNVVVGKTAEEFATAITEGVTFTDYFVAAAKKIFGFTTALREGNFTLAKQIAETDFASIAQARYNQRVKEGQQSLQNALKAQEDFTRQALKNGIALEDLLDSEVKLGKTKNKTEAQNKNATKNSNSRINALKKETEEFKKFQESFKFNAPQHFFQDLQLFDKQIKEFSPEIEIKTKPFIELDLIKARLRQEELNQETENYNTRIQNLYSTINDLLSPAINTIFGALENGQNVFKALGQSLKALIVQLVATVAKAAILAAIFSAIPGGGAALGIAGSVAGGKGNFLGLFKNFIGLTGLTKAAAPTFSGGAGINAGGLQLAGQVVFVQRGPDLVGVLNQGNARIGRVG
jgi:hypothetical protein